MNLLTMVVMEIIAVIALIAIFVTFTKLEKNKVGIKEELSLTEKAIALSQKKKIKERNSLSTSLEKEALIEMINAGALDITIEELERLNTRDTKAGGCCMNKKIEVNPIGEDVISPAECKEKMYELSRVIKLDPDKDPGKLRSRLDTLQVLAERMKAFANINY